MSEKTPEQIAKELLAKAKGKANGKTPPPSVDRSEGAALLNDVESFLKRFIAYPSEHAPVAHVLWVAHAHLMPAWESTPRIAFLSPEPASGKTRSMEVSELLVPDPVAAVNVTPAYMFRKCGSDSGPPTILFDEIDTVFGAKAKEHEELRALLNSGHRRGARAGRCVVRGKIVETEEISSYAAVALAGLGWLPDTILSRSIIIRMRRRTADEQIVPYRRRIQAPVGEALRKRLAGWAATILDEATEARPQMPHGVEDRDADCWESLLAIADIAGGQWPKRARAAAVALVAVTRDVEPSLNIRLLSDLRTIYTKNYKLVAVAVPPGLATKMVLAELCKLEDAPWKSIKDKPISDNQLSRRLRQYEIKPKNLHPLGANECKGYHLADLKEVWRRYLPPPEKPVEAVEPVVSELFQQENTTASTVGAVVSDLEPSKQALENPQKSDVSTASTASTAFSGNGGDGPAGLSWREIERLAREVEDWAYAHRDEVDLTKASVVEAEIRRRLAGKVLPEAVEIELERVIAALFNAPPKPSEPESDDLSIPTFLRREPGARYNVIGQALPDSRCVVCHEVGTEPVMKIKRNRPREKPEPMHKKCAEERFK